MHIVELGNRGYLGSTEKGKPAVVQSAGAARTFETLNQAKKAIARVQKTQPDFDMSAATPIVATRRRT